VDRQHARAQIQHRSDSASHGVGDVVQFQVEEDRPARDRPHAHCAMGEEELQPQFEQPDIGCGGGGPALGTGEIGGVEGDDQFVRGHGSLRR
jgi:hypothetical protein